MLALYFFWFLLPFSDNLSVRFDPNHLKLTRKPSNLLSLFSSLLKMDQFAALSTFLRTESSDFIPIYCNLWRTVDTSELIPRIWETFKRGEIDQTDLSELLLPECIAKSIINLINLSDQMVRIIPHSFLEVKDVSVYLFPSVLETILKKAILFTKPHDPRIRWFDWISSPDFDFRAPFASPFYIKYGWQLVDPEGFSTLSATKTKCLLNWINRYDKSDAISSDKELLMRALTLASWQSVNGIEDLSLFLIRQRQTNPTIYLSIRILTRNKLTIDLLLEVIKSLGGSDILVIGDWFIGIFSLWKKHLKSLKADQIELETILNFVIFDLDPSFRGILKLPSLFDDQIHPLIEAKSIEKYQKGPNLKHFYREFPRFFQFHYKSISLQLRWSSLLRKKRTFSTAQGPFLLDQNFDLSLLHGKEADFLHQFASKFRNGAKNLGNIALNPVSMTFRGKFVNFRSLVEMFLIAIAETKQLFTLTADGEVIMKPDCPEYFWELIGYFLVQARILNISSVPFRLEKEFFLEMYKKTISISYIFKLVGPYQKCPMSQLLVLNMNLREKFTVISLNSDVSNDNFPHVNCQQAAIKLVKRGMQAMRKGIHYVLDSFNFGGEELYSILFINK